ncbi:hypothetical protein Tco_0981743, partial [Tanacetum coccineum]
ELFRRLKIQDLIATTDLKLSAIYHVWFSVTTIVEPSATEDLFSGGESDIQRIKANGKCTCFFRRNPPNTNMLINGPIWAVFYLIPLQLKRKRNHMLEIVVKGKQDFRAIYFSQCLVEWFVVPPANTDQHKPRPKNPNQKHRERTLEEYMKLAAGSSSAILFQGKRRLIIHSVTTPLIISSFTS